MWSCSVRQSGFLLIQAAELNFIPLFVYFITLLQVFEQHSERWLVNYAYCILILNFI